MRLTKHAEHVCKEKNIDLEDVADAAYDPDVSYDSYKHPGQRKHIKHGLCVVLDPAKAVIITVFVHKEKTPLRPDQIAAGAVIR